MYSGSVLSITKKFSISALSKLMIACIFCFLFRCPYPLLLFLFQAHHLQVDFNIKNKVDIMVVYHVSTFII